MEEWRDAIGYEGLYQVSSLGRVKSLARQSTHAYSGTRLLTERIMKQCLAGNVRFGGYPAVHLSKDGRARMQFVHRLVGRAFLGLSATEQINHRNGIKTDNSVQNLEAVTPQQNIRHAVESGLRNALYGEKNHKAKLKAADIPQIRLRIAAGEPAKKIATDFGVLPTAIRDIATGHRWVNVR